MITFKQLNIHTKSASDVKECLLLNVCKQTHLFSSFPPLDTSSIPPLPDILDCLSNLSQRRSLIAGLRWYHTRSTLSAGTSRTEGSCINTAQPSLFILCHSYCMCTVIKAIPCRAMKYDPAKNESQGRNSHQTVMECSPCIEALHQDTMTSTSFN